MRKTVFLLLAAILACACILPTIAAAVAPDQSPAQAEALAAFERFQSLWLERGEPATPTLSDGTLSITNIDENSSFYEPFDGFSIQAVTGGNEEGSPMYICGAESNDSFAIDTLWTIFSVCMRAVEPAMTENVARELMQELLFAMMPLSEELPGVILGQVYYSRWSFMITVMEDGDQGPMMTISPKDSIREPEGTSTARLNAVYRRFREIATGLGFSLLADSPGEWNDSDPAGRQFIRPLAQDAWWHMIFLGDAFAGQGIRLLANSQLYGHDDELFLALAVALDPSLSQNDIDAMYAQLQTQTQDMPGGKTSRLLVDDTQYLLTVTSDQCSLMALRQSAFDE